jgi:hypothetical protein
VIIVSEETGTVSLAIRGKLIRGLKNDTLRTKLLEAFGQNAPKRGRLSGRSNAVAAFSFVRQRIPSNTQAAAKSAAVKVGEERVGTE